MTVLVAGASRHGATEEIAEAIGKRIHADGLAVDVLRLPDPSRYGPRPDPAQYDAVILGSGVYLGRWLASAREFLTLHEKTLAAMPVWAFSSGPIGPHGAEHEDRVDVATVLAAVHPVDYRIFGGKLDPGRLGLAERALVTLIRAHEEDNRDWDEISTWAGEISQAVQAQAPDLSGSSPAVGRE
jgi:menaquinone-dependent protoporphyrinogen oxidase